MDNFFVVKDEILTVLTTLKSQPFLILKPVSTFKNVDPIYFQLFLGIVLTLFCYIQDKRRNVTSYFDRVWSTAPILFSASLVAHYYVHHQEKIHTRLVVCLLLISLWGVRLTYNFYIKGGFKPTHEDYRWSQIRTWFTGKAWKWNLFELFFINIYSMVTVWCFTVLPLYVIYHSSYSSSSNRITFLDVACISLFLAFLLIETIADRQMYAFQSLKRQKILSRNYCQFRDYEVREGFFCGGLYQYSRHPNYFGEIGQWWVIYIYAALSAGSSAQQYLVNWTIFGALNLTFLIYRGLLFTEAMTSFKYPNYKYYQARTSAIVPWFPAPKKVKQR